MNATPSAALAGAPPGARRPALDSETGFGRMGRRRTELSGCTTGSALGTPFGQTRKEGRDEAQSRQLFRERRGGAVLHRPNDGGIRLASIASEKEASMTVAFRGPRSSKSHGGACEPRNGALEIEAELIAAWKSGDRAAGNAIIVACTPFVTSIAYEYRRWGLAQDDIVQEGNIGLLKAADRFDATRGCRLVTYAAYWIRAEIRDYVVRAYRIVRLGSSKGERRALRKYRTTRERDIGELSRSSGLSEARVALLLPLLTSRDAALDVVDGGGVTPSERLAHPDPSPEEVIGGSQERSRLGRALQLAMGELCPREQHIMRARWLTEDPQTLEQVGAFLAISKERVRQLEDRAKKRMRSRIEALVAEGPLAA